jgi:hypothetical protein
MGKVQLVACVLLVIGSGCGSSESESGDDKAAAGGSSAAAGGSSAAAGGSSASAGRAPTVDLSKMAQGNWSDKILEVALQHETCETRGPALANLAKEAEAAGQPGWTAVLLANVAGCLAEQGELDQAMVRLTRAVDLGLTDCFYLRTDPQMKKLAGRDDFAGLLDRIRTSPADVHEIAWQAAEMQAIMHDTSMMISENMNRVDGDQTVVPQSALPTRDTRDPAVIAGRLLLSSLQAHQKGMVLQSDQSRISHNVNMNIIDNMGDGTGGGRSSPQRVQQSRMLAQQAAQQRAQQVAQRAFKDSGASTEVVACSAIPD